MFEHFARALRSFTTPPDISWTDGRNNYVIKTVDRKPSILGFAGRLYSGDVIFAAHYVQRHEMHLSVNPLAAYLVIDFTSSDSRVAVKVTHGAAEEIAKAYGVRLKELDDNGRPIVRKIKA